jgi:ribonucleoside-diphosphate reductase alpha chain
MFVRKHNGGTELLNINKITKSVEWACKDISKVSVSDILMNAKLHFYDGIETSYILDTTIKVADDMASERTPQYADVARNLKLQKLYKNVFKDVVPCSLLTYISDRKAIYNENIYKAYTNFGNRLEEAVDHKRDFSLTSSGLDALLLQYGVAGETPQFIYMLVAMDVFHDSPKDCIDMYNALSTYKIQLPTPEMLALRFKDKKTQKPKTDYVSCCAINRGDSVESWVEADSALTKHTVNSAGVGISIADSSPKSRFLICINSFSIWSFNWFI